MCRLVADSRTRRLALLTATDDPEDAADAAECPG